MDNRNKLKVWLQQHHLTQKDLAQLIQQTTGRPCAVRAVKSWLCPPEKQRPALPGLGDSGTQSHG